MLPNGDANSKDIGYDASVSTHTHTTYEIVNFKTAVDSAINQIKGGVPEDGDTLGKLYDYIVSGATQIVVPDIASRDALEINRIQTQVFVVDAGNGKWALFKPLSVGVSPEYVKISDQDTLNSSLGVEPLTSKNLPNGTEASPSQLVMGNDVRLTDARPPLQHSHNVSNIIGLESEIDNSVDKKIASLNVGVISINDKTGYVKLDKSDLRLEKVDNTSDLDKPISNRVSLALDQKISNTLLPSTFQAKDNELVMGNDTRLRDSRDPNPHYHTTDDIKNIVDFVSAQVTQIISTQSNGVQFVNGKEGIVDLTKYDIDLGNVDNTSDLDKPVSLLQQSALDKKININMLPLDHVAQFNEIVTGKDPRLSDARRPLPHISDTILDFTSASTKVAKHTISDIVNHEDSDFIFDGTKLSLSPIPELTSGSFTRVTVNESGRVISGTNPTSLSELGIEDTYSKTQIDTILHTLNQTLESNAPNRFVKLNDRGLIPEEFMVEPIHVIPKFNRFPVPGNPSHLYINQEDNSIYRFENNEYVALSSGKTSSTGPISYTDIADLPTFAKVAKTGNYFDLTSLPVFAPVAKSGSYKDLHHTPVYSTVANTGSYNDLADLPVYADVASSGSYLDLHNRPNLSPVAETGSFNDLFDKPAFNDLVSITDDVVYKTKTLNYIGNLKPNEGKARWYPERNVHIVRAYATILEPSSEIIKCVVNYNSQLVEHGIIELPQGEYRSIDCELNFPIKVTDFLTIDIVEASSGKNLSITIVYR